jgi:hypothetical protein
MQLVNVNMVNTLYRFVVTPANFLIALNKTHKLEYNAAYHQHGEKILKIEKLGRQSISRSPTSSIFQVHPQHPQLNRKSIKLK